MLPAEVLEALRIRRDIRCAEVSEQLLEAFFQSFKVFLQVHRMSPENKNRPAGKAERSR
jgi:hypothetical protein